MATHSSILAWRIPWTEELSGLQTMGSQRVRQDRVTNTSFIISYLAMWETPLQFLGKEDLLEKGRDRLPTPVFLGSAGKKFHCGSGGKESACNEGDLGLIPGLGRSPGEGKGYPFQYSEWRIPWTTIHGVVKGWTRLSDFSQYSPFSNWYFLLSSELNNNSIFSRN